MRLLIDNPFHTPFMRDDAADEPVALFEGHRREYIALTFEVGTRSPSLWLNPTAERYPQLFGCEADTELVRIKDSTSEPLTLRALAEDIARCYLTFMRVRSSVVSCRVSWN